MNLNLAPRRINTRSHPDPEKILWQTFKTRNLATYRTIHRASSVLEHLTALQDPQLDLHHTRNLFRTNSQSKINHTDLEPIDLQQSPSREASPSTPPDLQLLHHFSSFHPKSAQSQFTGPSTSATPIHTTTVQTTPSHSTNPPLVNPPLAPTMAAWYAPLVLPQPLVPLPNDYQSRIPHFTEVESTTTQLHVDRMNDAFDYMELEEETMNMRKIGRAHV